VGAGCNANGSAARFSLWFILLSSARGSDDSQDEVCVWDDHRSRGEVTGW